MTGTVYNPTTASLSDGLNLPNSLSGKAGEDVVSELHGKYYTQAYRGEMFYASQIAPVLSTIYSATTITGFQIWNTNTNKNIIPVKMIVGCNVIPSAPGTLGLVIQKNVGFAAATGAQILTQTLVAGLTPQNCNTGSGVSSNATIGTGGTITTAPTLSQYCGLAGLENVVLTISEPFMSLTVDFDGMFVWAPGTFVSLGTAIANTGSFTTTMFWYEAPV